MFYLQTQCSCLLVYFFSERSVFKFKAFFCLLRVSMKESAAQTEFEPTAYRLKSAASIATTKLASTFL